MEAACLPRVLVSRLDLLAKHLCVRQSAPQTQLFLVIQNLLDKQQITLYRFFRYRDAIHQTAPVYSIPWLSGIRHPPCRLGSKPTRLCSQQ